MQIDIDRQFGCLKEGFKVSSGTDEWYISRYGTDFENSEMARLETQKPCVVWFLWT